MSLRHILRERINGALRRLRRAPTARDRAQAQRELENLERQRRDERNRGGSGTPARGPAVEQGLPPQGGWERTSYYPGYQTHGSPEALAETTGQINWIPVGSSNVEAIRWVDVDEYPLQVMFLAKHNSPRSIYGYKATFEDYDDAFSAGSVGRFVHQRLKNLPYKKLS